MERRCCEIDGNQSQQQHPAFGSGGPEVERVELRAGRIVRRNRINFAHAGTQCVHARDDAELRDQRESKHENDKDIASCKGMWRATSQLAKEQGAGQED